MGSPAWLWILILLWLGCGRADPPLTEPENKPYSLIWISLDTLRADHLGIYGYPRDTSPYLDQLARRGLYFDWAISPQNSTLPSHVTQFTGYHPVVHRIMHSRKCNPGVKMGNSMRTLTQVLQDVGYATRAWTDGGKVASVYGFDRGFEVYEEVMQPFAEKLDRVVEHIAGLEPGRPFFCFIHTYQMHAPYPAPPPYDTLFLTEGVRRKAQIKLDLYDGCIRYIDDLLQPFIQGLEERGVLESTLVVITADHGESFWDHGIPEIGHGSHSLHQNITRVPWILLHPDPAFQKRHITDLVGIIDFPNTMLPLLGVKEVLPGGGVNVLGSEMGKRRCYLSWTKHSLSLYNGPYHLVESAKYKDPESNALYRIDVDTQEKNPILDPEQVTPIRSLLRERFTALQKESEKQTTGLRSERPKSDRTSAHYKQLKELGYIK